MKEETLCHYCKRPITVFERTVDHIVPRARGGLDIRLNRVWACRDCNSRKADDFPSCRCNKCRKTIRYHWEHLRINKASGRKNKQ